MVVSRYQKLLILENAEIQDSISVSSYDAPGSGFERGGNWLWPDLTARVIPGFCAELSI